MNNNSLPITQNIYNSRIEYPIQISQNLNLFYMPDKPQICIPYMSFYPIYGMPLLQNNIPQQMLMDINNDNKQIPVSYNFTYNNIFTPINTIQYYNSIPQVVNSHLTFYPYTVSSNPKGSCFLNKKRSSTIFYEKENEKINVEVKTEEEVIQMKDIPKVKEVNLLENNETKIMSNDENIYIEKIDKENKEVKIEENVTEKMDISSVGFEKDIEEKTVKKKDGKKKRRNYAELLQDTLLEHIGEPKKKINITATEPPKANLKLHIIKPNVKNKNKSKSINLRNNISLSNKLLSLDEKQAENSNIKDNNKKSKIKNHRNTKKKQHKLTIKNNNDILADLQKDKKNVKNEANNKLTKVIYHGDNYENTKSVKDFMKYNFDFSDEEQYKSKKIITDYEYQHVDIAKINEKCYENYNSNEQNLENIEQKWSREKFSGDNKELKKYLNIISDSFPGRKAYTNEEKYLNILKNNDYKIENFLKSKQIK